MSVLVVEDADTGTVLRYLHAIEDVASRCARPAEALVLLAELRQHVMAIGADGGRLDATTWAAWTTSAFDRAIAILGGAVTTSAAAARIGYLPAPQLVPDPTPELVPDGQEALPI